MPSAEPRRALSDASVRTVFAGGPHVSYVRSVIPEFTNAPASAAALDATPVIVSRAALKLAAVNLAIGAAAVWTASQLPGQFVVNAFGQVAWQVVLTVLLYVVVAAALPLQALLLTRPLVRDVVQNSAAPVLFKAYAALGVSAGSVLTLVACGRAVSAMFGLAP